MATTDPPHAAEITAAFGRRLRRLRDASELSQQETAHRLGITYHRLTKYEAGKREPPLWLLVRMSEYYKVTLDFLVKGPKSSGGAVPPNISGVSTPENGAWMWETDTDGRFTATTGLLNLSDVVGKSRRELARYPTISWDDLDHIMNQRLPIENLCYSVKVNSGTRCCKISGKPVFDPGGNYTGYRGFGVALKGKELAEYQRFVAQQQRDNLIR